MINANRFRDRIGAQAQQDFGARVQSNAGTDQTPVPISKRSIQ